MKDVPTTVLSGGSRGVSLSCQESVDGADPGGRDAREPDERKPAEKLAVRDNACGLWQVMLEEYTVRRHAVMGDRLPALEGLVKTWFGSSSGESFSGLWKRELVDDLTWQSGGQHMDSIVRIPWDRYRRPGW